MVAANQRDLSQAYRRISERHLQMAAALLPNFPEGAMFHIYHAFESIICAALAFNGSQVPDAHWKKLRDFQGQFQNYPFSNLVSNVATLVGGVRDAALYPRERGIQVFIQDPDVRWALADVQALHADVQRAVNEIIQTLGLC